MTPAGENNDILARSSKARRVSSMFARISGHYDLMNAVMTAGYDARWRRLAVRLATQDQPRGLALDLATGTGDLALELARRPEVTAVVGLDFVPEMLDLARSKAQRNGPQKPLSLTLGDALALPFPDGAFGCVVSGFAMRNVADLKCALAEMARVVRPGGRVVVLEMTPADKTSIISKLPALYFSRVVPFLGQFLAGDRAAYAYLPDSVIGFPTAGELARLMAGAGLVHVKWRLLGGGLVAIHTAEHP